MKPSIRKALEEDVAAISALIVAAIRETNAMDYPKHFIKDLLENFSPVRIRERLTSRTVFVASDEGQVVGTASLDGQTVRSVFVLPHMQKHGVGKSLMNHLEREAQRRSLSTLVVPSSITAQGFYERLGYRKVRDEWEGEERIILMSKSLSA